MDLQYIGQTTFKSLNKKKQAIFFSLLRKVFIVVPLTYLLPYALGMGNKRCVYGGTGLKCDRWKPVLSHDACHRDSGIKSYGKTKIS